MCVTESHDRRIVVVIARAMVPVSYARVGTELYHPERHRGSGITVPVPARPDEHVHELCESLVARSLILLRGTIECPQVQASLRRHRQTRQRSGLQKQSSRHILRHSAGLLKTSYTL